MNLKLKVLKRSEWNPGAVGHLIVLCVLLWQWMHNPQQYGWPVAAFVVLLATCAQGRTKVEVKDD